MNIENKTIDGNNREEESYSSPEITQNSKQEIPTEEAFNIENNLLYSLLVLIFYYGLNLNIK